MLVHKDWLLTSARATLHLPTATAVVADLHLGYAQVRQHSGEAVPALDLDALLAPLRTLFAQHHVRRLVIAGDLCENAERSAPLAELLDELRRAKVELAGVVPGNHDRGLAKHEALPLFPEGFSLAGWRIVHGDGLLPRGPIVQGHEHPCLRWGDGHAAPCFLVGARRLVLPAYSPEAAGVNVLHAKRWKCYRCCAIAGDKVLDFGKLSELPQKLRRLRLSIPHSKLLP